MIKYLIILCLLCVGCATITPSPPQDIRVVTAIPTIENSNTPIATPKPLNLDAVESCAASENSPTLPDYIPSDLAWVIIGASGLEQNTISYPIYGINYYPRLSPFERFLTDSESEVISKELEFVTSSGINTLRLSINLDQLFDCEIQAVPIEDTFTSLDMIIQTIADSGLHLIVNLHQTIDDPNQQNWEQLQFIISRYQNEPAIIAWDILKNGDNLYDTLSSEVVLSWLGRAIRAIRQVTEHHLVTASWQENATDTIELVDIISFQHFGDYLPLRQEIANLKSQTDKPIVLSAIGFSTFDVDETAQRNLLFQSMEEVENNDLAGWVIYMAFDYPTSVTCTPPDCPTSATSINYYGIWNTSYFPKLAVDAVKRVTQTE